jgi:MATE family multidrug resistance protein
MGRPWVPVLIILGGVALNAVLNWVFIYGHLGAPRLGLTGAGHLDPHLAHPRLRRRSSRGCGWTRRCASAWPRRWLAPLSGPRLRRMLGGRACRVSGSLLFEGGAFAAATS